MKIQFNKKFIENYHKRYDSFYKEIELVEKKYQQPINTWFPERSFKFKDTFYLTGSTFYWHYFIDLPLEIRQEIENCAQKYFKRQ